MQGLRVMEQLQDKNAMVTSPDDDGDESAKTMSLMSGVAMAEDLPDADAIDVDAGKSSGKMLTQGTLLVLALAVVGGGSLYAMRITQGELSNDEGSKVIEERVEQALATALAKGAWNNRAVIDELLGDTESALAAFTSDPVKHQVPIKYVKKNPFVMFAGEKKTNAEPEPKTAEGQHTRNEQLRRDRFMQQAKKLEVQAVMGGARPVAIINGKPLELGQSVQGFEIKKIEGLRVLVQKEGYLFMLAIKQDK
jgi:hypothetical protein